MNRIRTKLLIAAAIPATLGVLYAAMWGVVYLAIAGLWPFSPLKRINEELVLENGGKIVIAGTEDRGFGSDGFVFEANYQPQNSETYELIGSWVSHQSTPEVFLVDDLIVVLNPDQKRLHVRTRTGTWKWFLMNFPDAATSLPLSHYAALTSLTEETLLKVRNLKNDQLNSYSPNAFIKSFKPENQELVVVYDPGPGLSIKLILSLAKDGNHLELKRIER